MWENKYEKKFDEYVRIDDKIDSAVHNDYQSQIFSMLEQREKMLETLEGFVEKNSKNKSIFEGFKEVNEKYHKHSLNIEKSYNKIKKEAKRNLLDK